MKLTNPTNDILDEAFVKVISHWEPTKQSIEAARSWAEITGGDESTEACYAEAYHSDRPKYSTSADAILPWLEYHHWRGHSNGMSGIVDGGGYPHFSIHVAEIPVKERPERFGFEHEGHGFQGESLKESFARSATIALLRAHSVEINFTKETT